MRRDKFDVDLRNAEGTEQETPVVAITFTGPDGRLTERLVTDDGPLDAGEIDVTYRLKTAVDDDDATGVLSVANRLTGEFILEVNVDPEALLELVGTARDAADDDETSYRLRLTDGEGKTHVYDKRTLLVYDDDGSLLRGDSLIPGGVEL